MNTTTTTSPVRSRSSPPRSSPPPTKQLNGSSNAAEQHHHRSSCRCIWLFCVAVVTLYPISLQRKLLESLFQDTVEGWLPESLTSAATDEVVKASSRSRVKSKLGSVSGTISKHYADLAINDTSRVVYYGARSENGTLGYVADPTALRRVRSRFLKIKLNKSAATNPDAGPESVFLSTAQFKSKYREGTWSHETPLTAESVCTPPGGAYLELEGGIELLKKIEISKVDVSNAPRLLCLVYTEHHSRDLARAGALTWGYKCDGYLAFSTETIPTLGVVNISHPGAESENNLWQKVRSIWSYVKEHYLEDYDYFHLTGDDTFVIVENLKRLITQVTANLTKADEPVLLGQWVKENDNSVTVGGGPGYTLNRLAVKRLADELLRDCSPDAVSRADAWHVSICMRRIGVSPSDSREFETGEQLYHNIDPNSLYRLRPAPRPYDAKMALYWASLPHPDTDRHKNQAVGIKSGLGAAGRYSVSFHYIRHPLFLLRIHAILYRSCAVDTPLGEDLMRPAKENVRAQKFGALFPNGTEGFIADPTSLKRERLAFLRTHFSNATGEEEEFFLGLEHFESHLRNGTWSSDAALTEQQICLQAGGEYQEKEGGFQLLKKIQVANDTQSPRILCSIYTYDKMRDLSRASALSWGYKCDGFLAFSTETIPPLGTLSLVHPGPESYQNMWQKVRSIWAYIHEYYLMDYDYFHLGGDDLFVIVENMRHFLSLVDKRLKPGEPVLLGQTIRYPGGELGIGGGPGYTLNRAALKRLVDQVMPVCGLNMEVPHEDRMISNCMRQIGVIPGDTRDAETGEQQYHNLDPDRVFKLARNRADYDSVQLGHWSMMPHPDTVNHPSELVGDKVGMEAAGKHSIAFHYIRHPLFLGRLHAILYRSCPSHYQLAQSIAEPMKEMPAPPARPLPTGPWFGARFENGTHGYVADPTSLRRQRLSFLQSRFNHSIPQNDGVFTTLEHYESQWRVGTWSEETPLTEKMICLPSGGSYEEKPGGFELLERIKIANVTESPRILCAVYTYPHMRDVARASALSWGYKCDGFLAFSTENIPGLGFVNLIHPGVESYDNMWQKVRSIWAYIHEHYITQFDYFHLGGDDMFVVVENLRHFLASVSQRVSPDDPVLLGQLVEEIDGSDGIGGGPGYTMNQAALQLFATKALPKCEKDTLKPFEDRLVSYCMRQLGVFPFDTRDINGLQRYHNLDPDRLFRNRRGGRDYDSVLLGYWSVRPHPDKVNHPNETVGEKVGMEAASPLSVTFHYIRHPLFLGRLHAILYRSCPAEWPLAESIMGWLNKTRLE